MPKYKIEAILNSFYRNIVKDIEESEEVEDFKVYGIPSFGKLRFNTKLFLKRKARDKKNSNST